MADDLEQTLATIAKFADERKMRLARVTVGEVSFELQPDDSTAPAADAKPEAKPPDPWNNPKTYGFEDYVPGFKDPRAKEDGQ